MTFLPLFLLFGTISGAQYPKGKKTKETHMVLLREQQPPLKQQPRRNNGLLGVLILVVVVVIGIALLTNTIRVNKNSPSKNTTGKATNVNGVLVNAPLEVVIPQIVDQIKSTLANGDYAVLVTPSLRSAKPGEKTNYTIRVVRSASASQTIALTVAGLPKDATQDMSQATLINDSDTSTLTITLPDSTQLGKYELTIAANAGTEMHSASAVLTVSDLAATKIAVSNVRAMDTGTKWQASIAWQTDIPANTWVEYATESAFIAKNQEYSFTANETGNNTDHAATLSYLEPATTYHYRIRSVDKLGNTVVSDDLTFTTQ